MARDKFFDSIKFLLVFGVAFIHLVEINIDEKANLIVYSYLMTFLMPLFIFISGYFSKGITWEKYKKSFISLLAVYIVFQIIFSLPNILGDNFDLIKLLILPAGVLWYIVGLVIWRLLIYLIKDISFIWALSFFLIIGIAFGFYDQAVKGSRILIFFPFFIMGYYCPKNIIERIRALNKFYTTAFAIAFLICLYFWVDRIDLNDKYYYLNLFSEIPYSRYPSIIQGVLYRIVMYVSAVLMSICFINLSTERFYKYGSLTMFVFLLHYLFIHFLYNIYGLLKIDIIQPVYIDFIYTIIICIIIIYISRFKAVQYLVDPYSLYKKVAAKM